MDGSVLQPHDLQFRVSLAHHSGQWWTASLSEHHEDLHLREASVDHKQGAEGAVCLLQQQAGHCRSW